MSLPRQPDATGRVTGNPWIRWHPDPNTCPHHNDNICPTCDFDSYYATTHPDCP